MVYINFYNGRRIRIMKNIYKKQILKTDEREISQYAVGALLYTPASNKEISEVICTKKYDYLTSISLCLEDAIADNSVAVAEEQAIKTLMKISNAAEKGEISSKDLPFIFIRIRNPKHLQELFPKISDYGNVLTGFVLPKFDLSNANDYKEIILKINEESEKKYYFMPTLESESIISISTRRNVLVSLKEIVDSISQYILNIRLGGNDFCNKFALRRSDQETIYDIAVVRDTIIDIFNIFGRDYVVSGVVWEYFDNNRDDNWRTGLEKELALDKLNGFIGKTAIHPSQLPIIFNSMKVSSENYEDAKSILNWESDSLGVVKSYNGKRMNESKVHTNWANRIIRLAHIYGVNEA